MGFCGEVPPCCWLTARAATHAILPLTTLIGGARQRHTMGSLLGQSAAERGGVTAILVPFLCANGYENCWLPLGSQHFIFSKNFFCCYYFFFLTIPLKIMRNAAFRGNRLKIVAWLPLKWSRHCFLLSFFCCCVPGSLPSSASTSSHCPWDQVGAVQPWGLRKPEAWGSLGNVGCMSTVCWGRLTWYSVVLCHVAYMACGLAVVQPHTACGWLTHGLKPFRSWTALIHSIIRIDKISGTPPPFFCLRT